MIETILTLTEIAEDHAHPRPTHTVDAFDFARIYVSYISAEEPLYSLDCYIEQNLDQILANINTIMRKLDRWFFVCLF